MPSLALACRLSAVSMALRRAYPDAFSPASLFANGEQGLWYDVGDFDRYMSELGPELVTNGGFDVNANGWSYLGTLQYDSANKRLNLTPSATDQDLTTTTAFAGVVGKTYLITQTVWHNYPYAMEWEMKFSNGFGRGTVQPNTPTKISAVYTLTSSTSIYQTRAAGLATGYQWWIDNISVRELTAINTATLFQDAAGTIPVTAVEQPVGLILDKSKGLVLGPELVTNGDFSNGTTGWQAVQISGTATISENAGRCDVNLVSGFNLGLQTVDSILTAGKWYEVRFNYIRGSEPMGVLEISGIVVSTTNGNNVVRIRAASSGKLVIITYGGWTIPAGLLFSIDNISVRELPGNHASQATTTARGVLRARYNLLTYSEDFSNAAWVKTGVIVGTEKFAAADGSQNAVRVTADTSTGSHNIGRTLTVGAGTRMVNSVDVKADTASVIAMLPAIGGTHFNYAHNNVVRFDLVTGNTIGSVPSGVTVSAVNKGNGWWRLSVSGTAPFANDAFSLVFLNPNDVSGTTSSSYTGNGTDSVFVSYPDLRPANLPSGLPAYQRIAAATDYDTVGFPVYLDIDGTDDNYVTGSIDFSATDKMTVWAGMRKLDDAARIFLETSANWNSNTGTMLVLTGDAVPTVGDVYSSASRGAGDVSYGGYTTAGARADTSVITVQHNISGDLSSIRRNGSSAGATVGTSDQGTGNFGNYPIYLFSRGGTSFRWRGHFYGLIIRGAATETTPLEQTEQWLNTRMGGIY